MSHRILQINELIREHIGEIISREVSLKTGVLTTITKVETSPDLRHAKAWVSIFPEHEEHYVMRTLSHERGRVQKSLYRKLHMKPMPVISFHHDQTEQNADVIEKLLLELK